MKPHSENRISGKAWMMILFLFSLTVISNADKAVIGFASVAIIKELGLTPSEWGLVGSVFFWLYSVSAILLGALADRIGTKRVIMIIASSWAAVQFATVFVSNFAGLLITRLILGTGEGPAYSLAMTSASKWLPKEKLGLGLTLVSIGGPLGVAVSAPLLMQLISQYGWRTAFLATGIVGAVWVLLWIWLAKENPAAAASLQAGPKPSHAYTPAAKPASNIFSFLFSKNFALVALCGLATYWSFTFGLVWLPNYFAKVLHLGEGEMKLAVTLPWVMITISQVLFSSISDRLYSKTRSVVRARVFIVGPVMLSAALCYFLGTVVSSNSLAVGLLSLGLTLGCITLVIGPAILLDLFPAEHQGKIQGTFMALASLGGIIGPYVTGVLVQGQADPIVGFHYAFYVCAILTLVFGGLVWLGVRPKQAAIPADRSESAISS